MGVTIHIHPFVASEGPWKPDRPELGGGGRGGRSQHTEMIRGGKGGKERGKERNRSSPGSGSRKCPFSHPISADLSTPGGQGKMKDHLVSQMWFSPSSPALPGLASCRPWGRPPWQEASPRLWPLLSSTCPYNGTDVTFQNSDLVSPFLQKCGRPPWPPPAIHTPPWRIVLPTATDTSTLT